MSKPDRDVNLDAVAYYRQIRGAMENRGCPLCRLLARSADRYVDTILWEMVLDPDYRSVLLQSRGFCRTHGWLLVRAGAALGVAILTRDILNTLLDEMASSAAGDGPESVLENLLHRLDRGRVSKPTAQLVAALSPQMPCPVCSHLESLEKDYVSTLLTHLEGPGALNEAYRASDGLCLEHVRQTLARAPSATVASTLVAAQREVWQRLHAELGEFIRKADHRYKGEPYGSERDSWRRAIEALCGPPPPTESERQSLTQPSRESG